MVLSRSLKSYKTRVFRNFGPAVVTGGSIFNRVPNWGRRLLHTRPLFWEIVWH